MTENQYWYIQAMLLLKYCSIIWKGGMGNPICYLINMGSNRVSEAGVIWLSASFSSKFETCYITTELITSLNQMLPTVTQSLSLPLPIYTCLLSPTWHVLPRFSSPDAPESPFLTVCFLFHPFLTLHSLSLRSLCYPVPTPHFWEKNFASNQ